MKYDFRFLPPFISSERDKLLTPPQPPLTSLTEILMSGMHSFKLGNDRSYLVNTTGGWMNKGDYINEKEKDSLSQSIILDPLLPT